MTENIVSPLSVVTEESITLLVEGFYAKVRRDPVLADIFNRTIAKDQWPDHLATMRKFWSSVMLTSRRYSGDPVTVHKAVLGLERSMFARWLQLFEQTADQLFEPAIAALFTEKARRIAMSLELAVFHRTDEPPDGLRLPPRRQAQPCD